MTTSEISKPRSWYTRLIDFCSVVFGLGVICLIVFSFGEQWPPAQEGALIVAAVLIAFGLFIPKRAYRIAAICLVIFGLFMAYRAHEKAAPIQEKLKQIGLDAGP
jgi:hypothetical protein